MQKSSPLIEGAKIGYIIFLLQQVQVAADFVGFVGIVDTDAVDAQQKGSHNRNDGQHRQAGTQVSAAIGRAGIKPEAHDDKAGYTQEEIDVHSVTFQQVGCPQNIHGCDRKYSCKQSQNHPQKFIFADLFKKLAALK